MWRVQFGLEVFKIPASNETHLYNLLWDKGIDPDTCIIRKLK